MYSCVEVSLLHLFDEGLQMLSLACSVFYPTGLPSNIALRGDMEAQDIAWHNIHPAGENVDRRLARRQSEHPD